LNIYTITLFKICKLGDLNIHSKIVPMVTYLLRAFNPKLNVVTEGHFLTFIHLKINSVNILYKF